MKCIERTLKQISRVVEVDARIDIWRKESGGDLLEGADWVIGVFCGVPSVCTTFSLTSCGSDAIDNITTKVDLLKYCHEHNIKVCCVSVPSGFGSSIENASCQVFSSMGSGAKCDPTRIQISDISYTMYDPLARSVRRRLRLEGVPSGIPVVYSTEVPGEIKLLPLPEEEFQKGNVKELGVFDDFRVRILPVLGECLPFMQCAIAPVLMSAVNCRSTSSHLRTEHRDIHPLRSLRKAHPQSAPHQGPQEIQRTPPTRPPKARREVAWTPDQVRASALPSVTPSCPTPRFPIVLSVSVPSY